MLLFEAATASAQLTVTISPVKRAGQKAVVPLALSNGLPQKIESARAVCFLLDEHGKMVGQATRWVIGNRKSKGLPAGGTNAFFFVVTSARPIATTNLTAKVSFTRLVLEGGKLADPSKDISIVNPGPAR